MWTDCLDAARFAEAALTYSIRDAAGAEIARSHRRLELLPDSVRLSQRLQYTDGRLDDEQSLVLDRSTLLPLRGRLLMGGGVEIFSLTRMGDRITGSMMKRGGVTEAVDMRVPPDLVLPGTALAIAAAADWTKCSDVVLPVLHGPDAIDTARLTLQGTAHIDRPSGATSVDVVNVTERGRSAILMIGREPPHRVLEERRPLGVAVLLEDG